MSKRNCITGKPCGKACIAPWKCCRKDGETPETHDCGKEGRSGKLCSEKTTKTSNKKKKPPNASDWHQRRALSDIDQRLKYTKAALQWINEKIYAADAAIWWKRAKASRISHSNFPPRGDDDALKRYIAEELTEIATNKAIEDGKDSVGVKDLAYATEFDAEIDIIFNGRFE